MGKNKALAHHTSTYFHTRRVSIELSCFRSPTLAGAPFGSHRRYSVSCPYQWPSLQPRQRKLSYIVANTGGRGRWTLSSQLTAAQFVESALFMSHNAVRVRILS